MQDQDSTDETRYYRDNLSADRLKRVYDVGGPRIQRYLRAEIDFVCERVAGCKRVLEAGCGYGRVLEQLIEPGRYVCGIDNSYTSIQLARGFLSADSIYGLVQSNALQMPFQSQSFDAVVCIQNGISAFHVGPRALVAELVRITESGGIVLLSSYSERFWKNRLEWFEVQSGEGLLGPIDYDKTGNGKIVCTDGFTATTFTPADFRNLIDSLRLNATIVEVDRSSLFCVIEVT